MKKTTTILFKWAKARSVSESLLVLNIALILLITFHVDTLNAFLKFELQSLEEQIAQNVTLSESLSFNNNNSTEIHDVSSGFSNKNIFLIATATILIVFFIFRQYGGGPISNIITDLHENIQIVKENTNEVLTPLERNHNTFDHIELEDGQLRNFLKEDYKDVFFVEKQLNRLTEDCYRRSLRLHDLKKVVAELDHVITEILKKYF